MKITAGYQLFFDICMLCLTGIGLGLFSLFLSTGVYGWQLFVFYLSQPLVLELNVLPFVLFNFLFFALTNRVWTSVALNGIVCLLYSCPNYWKLLARGDALFAEDLLIVSEALEMSQHYASLDGNICAVLAGIAALLALSFFCKGSIADYKKRLVLLLAVLVTGGTVYKNVYTDAAVYSRMQAWPAVNEWFTTNRYISRGGIYPFIYSIRDALNKKPENYDKEKAESVLLEYSSDDIPDNKKISVISVMLEAFTDLSECTDVITGADPYEAFHRLQEESISGTLVSNAFGGGTIDSERCFLTGFSQLTEFRHTSWSYARYFAEQGYQVTGSHAGYGGFYNRSNVNANLGFPEYRFIDNYYSQVPEGTLLDENDIPSELARFLDESYGSGIPMDYQFFTELTDYSKQQMETGPVFSFNITYQNHGPTPHESELFWREYVPRNELSEYDYNIINNYLAGIEDTCRRMADMQEAFRDYDKPVILVFFGDHKPWLGDQSVTYTALGIDIWSDSEDGFFNYYSTPYLIWANDSAKEILGSDVVGEGPRISPCYLMNVLFDICGWEGPSYMKLSNAVMEQTPILHSTTQSYWIDNQVMKRGSLSNDVCASLVNIEHVQYYLAYDAKGKLPD